MHAVETRAETFSSGVTGRFLLLSLGVWLHSADTLVTATLAPDIVAELEGVAYINWTISLYEVGAIIAGATAAALCACFGIKRIFVAATLLYAVGCALSGVAPDIAVLIGGRFVQGAGGGMLLTLCYVAIEAWFAPQLWGRLFGIEAAIWGAGSLLGPLIGGLFAGNHAWRGAFWAFAAQAALLWVAAVRFLPALPRASPPTPTPYPAFNWPIAPLSVLTAATVLIAEAGVSSSQAVAAVACVLGVGLLYVAARLDRRASNRLLPAQLLEPRHPVGAGLLLVFALCTTTTGFWAYGPLLAQILLGTRPLVTGYILASEAIAWSLATLAVSAVAPSADAWLIRGGAAAVMLALVGYSIAVPAGSLPGMIACGLLQGVGFGVCWPAIVQRLIRCASAPERSLASASASTVQRIGYAVGTAAVGIAANMSGLNDSLSTAAARAAGFWIFAAFIPLLLIGLLSAWIFTRE